ncbi:phage virion morphogenesis protein [Azorhizobium doebereinerae]|uniref:phage virion morphogenesis protein n=1 Tax=Azorhizobium doebereinerae TaxID=281091 RepID=UPI000684F0F0|nr:phage virion morphogenesis protein [Azorhizobium doebereinerae]
MRGGLIGSFTQRAAHGSVEVATNKIFDAVYQLGATIEPMHAPHLRLRFVTGPVRADSVTIPVRPFNGLAGEGARHIEELVLGALSRSVDL